MNAGRWSVLGLLMLMAVASATATGCSLLTHLHRSSSTTSVPADETRANGPLVGDPTLVAGEQSCAEGEQNLPWYPTIAAFEVHDSNRTHLYGCAHFSGTPTAASNTVFAFSSQQTYTTPYNLVELGPNAL
jgi:hypothetical protein